jgi:hypothetical protein
MLVGVTEIGPGASDLARENTGASAEGWEQTERVVFLPDHGTHGG